MQQENPEIFTAKFYENVAVLFDEAVKLETRWGQYIIEGGVLGLTDPIITNYIQWLADQRLALISLPALYGTKNPVPWVAKFSKVNDVKANFFEARVSNYSIGTLDW
jgi:ribonucleoside-diphosphate reductase beta chain